MSPETLIGVELGKSVLQRLLGQGTMGAVYLAEQAHLQRQVAVKVFFPASTLEKQEEFQQRLQKELALSASLAQPHILAILDHGEDRGLVYAIMPYVTGENLQTLLDRSGALPFAQIQQYLEQIASALDYAHARGILHRDLKTSNVLHSLEGRLLLADFGIAGLTTEKNFATARRPLPGMLDYIAPEYVLGKTIDLRADLYSLGVILYQMVTGTVPFQCASLSETAMKQVKATPPPPRSLREDLPQAAEQVLLRSLAKHPADRYSHAQNLAAAFRLALEAAQLLPAESQPAGALTLLSDLASGSTSAKVAHVSAPRKSGLFDPKWQTLALPLSGSDQQNRDSVPPTPVLPPPSGMTASPVEQQDTSLFNPFQGPANESEIAQDQVEQNSVADSSLKLENRHDLTEELNFAPREKMQTNLLGTPSPFPGSNENTGTFKKLTEPVKIVQLPVAGQPGRFMTGILPVLPAERAADPRRVNRYVKIASLLLAVLIVAGGGIFFWRSYSQGNSTAQKMPTPAASFRATSTLHSATATMKPGTILSDDLSQNIHNWPIGQHGQFTYTFKDGAYHIANNDSNRSAPATLDQALSGPFAYSLTMEQVKGDETSSNNQFGMILYANVQNIGNKQIDTFYAFEVLNAADGEYQFWKYDNSKDATNPWTSLWTSPLGKEFHQGSGSSHVNTVKVISHGQLFTFLVNGKQVGTWKDGSFSHGSIGMLVNLKGAEIAFSHLLLTNA